MMLQLFILFCRTAFIRFKCRQLDGNKSGTITTPTVLFYTLIANNYWSALSIKTAFVFPRSFSFNNFTLKSNDSFCSETIGAVFDSGQKFLDVFFFVFYIFASYNFLYVFDIFICTVFFIFYSFYFFPSTPFVKYFLFVRIESIIIIIFLGFCIPQKIFEKSLKFYSVFKK